MSTYFATFADWNQAQAAVHELVNGGVSPDDLSLIICRQSLGSSIRGDQGSVGDATYFVGRQDDPVRSGPLPKHPDVSELTTIEQSNVSPIDTSDIATDVESIDQMDDSQEEAELQTRPRMGISQGEHEVDDLALTLVTGFPTTPPMTDEVTAPEFEREEQYESALETLEIPGIGLVQGGGSLATAALDFAKLDGSCNVSGLVEQLTDDGVPQEAAHELQNQFRQGRAILAVVITPGELNEDAVEEIAERNGAQAQGLFDAPRYYDATLR